MSLRRKERPRIARWQKAAALVPLALLAAAWAASLGSDPAATADSLGRDPGAPSVPTVPTTAFHQAASTTRPSQITSPTVSSNGDRPGLDPTDPSSVSSNGIPSAAMAAYQRTEEILAKADPSCHLSWALVAAIGRVESDHGRYGGNVLSSAGKATPGIYGLPLDGSKGTAMIVDSDGGSYDDDPVYDRAVGPMQFLPSTWDIVGVDADGDGTKDPQDIDDAALATGVYLCAGTQDLSTTAGQRVAVFSYNHSAQYVELVLAVMNAYLDGNFAEVPDGLPTSTYIPAKPAPDRTPGTHGRTRRHHSAGPGSHRHTRPHAPSTPGPGGTDPGSTTSDPGSDDPTPGTEPPTSTPAVPDPTTVVQDPGGTMQQVVLSVQQASSKCTSKLGTFPLATDEMTSACTEVLTGLTAAEAADRLAGGTLAAVLTNLGLADLIPVDPTCLPIVCGS